MVRIRIQVIVVAGHKPWAWCVARDALSLHQSATIVLPLLLAHSFGYAFAPCATPHLHGAWSVKLNNLLDGLRPVLEVGILWVEQRHSAGLALREPLCGQPGPRSAMSSTM